MREGATTLVRGAKPIIGLAGGIGAGKSVVASILGEMGAAVIASDRLNHEELDSTEVLSRLRQWWGNAVVQPDGRADRRAIRRIVGRDGAARERLERLVHPRIARRREELTRRHQADPSVRAIVWDSPLLYEVGLAEQCDYVLFVEADEEIRLERVTRDRAWTAGDLDRLEKSQGPLDFKRDSADYRVVNNSGIDELRRQVEDVFSRILSGG